MRFSLLHFTQFRNYEQLELAPGPGVNVFTGNNGAGKTNILEGIHYLSMTRGFSGQGEKFSLQEGAPWFTVMGMLEEESSALKIQCSYQPPRGKKMILNGQPLLKMSEHIGNVPLVTVLPSDTSLITGGPAVRRKFLDTFISQYDPAYLLNLIQYEKALEQRNALLAQFATLRNWDREQLELWERQLWQSGRYLFAGRQQFISAFGPQFAAWFSMLVSGKEQPSFIYQSHIRENSENEWKALFEQHLDRDRYTQRTNAGVHKDDLQFIVNGQEVKDYGSQGQQKTYVLALRFAQYEMLESLKSRAPLLLLDDIFDKLDIHRLKAIAALLGERVKGQVFVTDASPERSRQVFGKTGGNAAEFFSVSGGIVKPA